MKLRLNDVEITECAGELTLSKTRSEAAVQSEFTLIGRLADFWFPSLSVSCGDRVQIEDETGTVVFSGSVHRVDWKPDTRLCRVTAYDKGIALTRNELYGVFYGTPETIIRQVCGSLGVEVGSLTVPGGAVSLTSGTGSSAFSILRRTFDGEYWMDEKNRLCCARYRGSTVVIDPQRVVTARAVSTLEDMVNYAEVRGYQGVCNGKAARSAEIARYGRFGKVFSLTGAISTAQTQAEQALCGITREGKVTLLGDWGIPPGGVVVLERGDWGFTGRYLIRGWEQSIQQGLHLTKLTLEKET